MRMVRYDPNDAILITEIGEGSVKYGAIIPGNRGFLFFDANDALVAAKFYGVSDGVDIDDLPPSEQDRIAQALEGTNVKVLA